MNLNQLKTTIEALVNPQTGSDYKSRAALAAPVLAQLDSVLAGKTKVDLSKPPEVISNQATVGPMHKKHPDMLDDAQFAEHKSTPAEKRAEVAEVKAEADRVAEEKAAEKKAEKKLAK